MTRVKSYFDFAFVFAGLGYVGAWALAPDRLAAVLSPGLQAAGLAMAVYAVICVVLLLRSRRRQAKAAAQQPAPSASIQSRSRLFRSRPQPARKTIKPRDHFGLRGAPR